MGTFKRGVIFWVVVAIFFGFYAWMIVSITQESHRLNRENTQVCGQIVQLVHFTNSEIREHPELFRGWALETIPQECHV